MSRYTPDDTERVPEQPDPFWPEGAVPKHLNPTQLEEKEIVDSYAALRGEVWKCEKCGTTLGQSIKNSRYCHECYALEVQNSALAKKTNDGWMEQSSELGLALYERQPEETDVEWRIWEAYRSYYPLKLPTWKELAERTGCAVATVTRAAARWSYRARLVAWARYTDDAIQEKRIAAIKEMNEKQLDMAKGIQNKLSVAIENLNPALLRPNEIVNLFKVATELERRVTTYVEEKVESTAVEAQSQSKPKTKVDDLNEVISILQSTGVLPGKDTKTVVGVEQKTTILVREDNND